ncbi:MAG: hypothetical protein Q9M19_03805 [Mariprofundaceae bacterium]|nr:hypothetical protein [Mariprofundaceae bacterium]
MPNSNPQQLEKMQQEAPSLVEQTLAISGFWDPVQYLLTIGRISQQDYEAWHLGEVSCLEHVFAGSPSRIKSMLDMAMLHAEKRQLQRLPKTWEGWGEHAGQSLRLFEDEDLNQHFSWLFQPLSDRPQLDLFMDAPHIVCLNRLRTALAQQSPHLSTLFADAFEDYANDISLARLESLWVAQQAFPDDAQARLIYFLQDIKPLAIEEFANPQHSTDFLAPLWRTLAQDLELQPFDPEKPKIHAATAWLEAKAYPETITSCKNIADWFQIPHFHACIIQAEYQQHHIPELRAAWFNYCLFCPQQALIHIGHAHYQQGLESAGLLHWWTSFNTLTHQPHISDFPAWVIIQQPEYLQSLPHIISSEQPENQRFSCVHALLNNQGSEQQQLQLRRTLLSSSAWLFNMLLKKKPGMF